MKYPVSTFSILSSNPRVLHMSHQNSHLHSVLAFTVIILVTFRDAWNNSNFRKIFKQACKVNPSTRNFPSYISDFQAISYIFVENCRRITIFVIHILWTICQYRNLFIEETSSPLYVLQKRNSVSRYCSQVS